MAVAEEDLQDVLRVLRSRTKPRPTIKQREQRTQTNQFRKRLEAREQYESSQREQTLAYAQALGQERARSAALREYAETSARSKAVQDIRRQQLPGTVAASAGSAIFKSGPGQSVFGTLGTLIAAIAIAIILYILLNAGANLTGTTNSALNFVHNLTSTDPLFTRTDQNQAG